MFMLKCPNTHRPVDWSTAAMLSRAQAADDSCHRQLLSLLAVALKSRLVKGVPLFVAAVRGEPLHLGDKILCHKSCVIPYCR